MLGICSTINNISSGHTADENPLTIVYAVFFSYVPSFSCAGSCCPLMMCVAGFGACRSSHHGCAKRTSTNFSGEARATKSMNGRGRNFLASESSTRSVACVRVVCVSLCVLILHRARHLVCAPTIYLVTACAFVCCDAVCCDAVCRDDAAMLSAVVLCGDVCCDFCLARRPARSRSCTRAPPSAICSSGSAT